MRVGVVVLTQGTRPSELRRALDSVLAQEDVEVDVIVVGNGWVPEGLPEGVRGLALAENLGIPGGRNRGVPEVDGEYLLFLDDDAWLSRPDFLRRSREILTADPRIGLLQPRLTVPGPDESPRRWIPRIRKGDPQRSSTIFSCLEAVLVMPRSVYDRTGGWGDPYFYAHEGIELAWRVWDADRIAWYAGDLEAHHPLVHPTRHASYLRMNARNRVWLAKRNLPVLLAPLYVGSWTLIQLLRWWRSPARLSAWFAGWREGWRTNPGGRRPLRWRTVARMTRYGRPPIV